MRAGGAVVTFTNNTFIAASDLTYDGQDIVIDGTTVTANGLHSFNSMEVNRAGTLSLGGGATLNIGGALDVSSNSVVLCQGTNASSQVNGQWAGVGVTINAGTANIDASSKISADGQGYLGGTQGAAGSGPGGGSGRGGFDAAGAGYGAPGGTQNETVPGQPYGSASTPTDLGSGGGGAGGAEPGGSGGGAIRLIVAQALTLDGLISANGDPGAGFSGAGSGGSLYVTAGILTGAGKFTANGGSRTGMVNSGGAGGGGRIAVYFGLNNSFAGFTASTADSGRADLPPGTVGFIETAGQGRLYVFKNFTFPEDSTLNFDAVTVTNGASLALGGGSTLNVAGNLSVSGGSTLLCQAKNTGAQVNSQWAGVGVTITAGSVTIDTASKISADSQGYKGGSNGATGSGPGGGSGRPGNDAAGAGYGGPGGTQNEALPGQPYGSATTPTDLGSGGGGAGGAEPGGSGGGAIRLIVGQTLALDGIISANGDPGRGSSGAGSGGSLYATAGILIGAGKFTANGGSRAGLGNDGGAGGAGRIAVYFGLNNSFAGFAASTANSGRADLPPGTVGFIETSGGQGRLYVFENFTFPEDSTLSFDAVTVTNAASLALGGGSTLSVTGNLSVSGGSTLLCQAKNTGAQVNSQWTGVGVTITAGSVTVDTASKMSADSQGYKGGTNGATGSGLGGGSGRSGNDAAGAGYGGPGGSQNDALPGQPYGSATRPTDLGSGGGGVGGRPEPGGSGGGAIRLIVAQTLALDGMISANGDPGGGYSGAGSGGSLYVTAGILTGAGKFTANGGSRAGMANSGGAGGGGRIAVYFGLNNSFAGFAASTANSGRADLPPGTVGFIETAGGQNRLYVFENFTFPEDSTLSFDAVTVTNAASLALGGGSTLSVTGNLNVSGGSTLLCQAKNTGAQVNSQWTGAGVTITAGNVTVDTASKISADSQGYKGGSNAATGSGPGGGSGRNGFDAAGAGYGGPGGTQNEAVPGKPYGSMTRPTELGSGGGGAGGAEPGGSGGGAIRLIVAQTLRLDGIISANGDPGGGYSGAGSGGSLYVTADILTGAGKFTANGGSRAGMVNGGGDGGGGRITIYLADLANNPTNQFTASAGGGGAQTGSVLVAHNQSFVKLEKTNNSFNLEWVTFPPHVYQLESTTNLAPTSWINVGGPITATNYTTIVSNAVGTDRQRFYRNILLP
jgi:hypothetical protein